MSVAAAAAAAAAAGSALCFFPFAFLPLLQFSLTKLSLGDRKRRTKFNPELSRDGGGTKTNQAPQRGRQAAPHQARGGLVETQKKTANK
jgi:hypothetical protein